MANPLPAHGVAVQPVVLRAMQFAVWCTDSPDDPTVERVMHKFRVSRATACRLLSACRSAQKGPG